MEFVKRNEVSLNGDLCFSKGRMKLKPSSSDSRSDKIPKDDLFLCLRPVLAMGQIFGGYPFGGAIKMNAEKLPYVTWVAFDSSRRILAKKFAH